MPPAFIQWCPECPHDVKLSPVENGATSVTIRCVDGIYVETVRIHKAETHVGQHAHAYDHTTVVVRGAMQVFADGVDMGVYREVSDILIPAGVKHRFVALEDDTTFTCVHNVARSGLVEVSAEHRIEEPV